MTSAMVMASSQGGQTTAGPTTITLWTKEGEADNALQWVYDLADAFNQIDPDQQVEVVKPGDVEALREDFQTASLAGTAPDLLWTVNDHAGPFTAADLIVWGLISLRPEKTTFTFSLPLEMLGLAEDGQYLLKELIRRRPWSEYGKQDWRGGELGQLSITPQPFVPYFFEVGEG